MGVHAKFSLSNRAEIEAEIERLIGLLDTADGDCDLEPEHDFCLAGDDGCAEIWRNGERLWGAETDQTLTVVPLYGIDQSRGPVNEREARRAQRH